MAYVKFSGGVFRPDPKPEPKEKKKKAKIKPMSDKRSKENKEYLSLRKVFLNGKKCQIEGCKRLATTVHHKRGRIGTLLCDIKYWLACCMDCHVEIENNPEWAKEMGYSLNRL